MKRTRLAAILIFLCVVSQQSFSQKPASAPAAKELEAAEAKMFEGIAKHDPTYFKNDVAEDYVSINADGVTQNKEQMIADSVRAKMMSDASVKLFDKQIRVYGNTGIITGRAQAFVHGTYVVEFLYTAIFVKRDNTWMFTGWQGTLSKDSPKPPPMPQG